MTQPNVAVEEDKETNDQAEFDLDPSVDPRAAIYADIDKQRGVYQDETQDEDQDEETEETTEDDKLSVEDADESEDLKVDDSGTTNKEDGSDEGPKVLSRAEFEDIFKGYSIKDKFAGEEVEVPVSEVIKGYGLEKHWTKKLQELSKREQDVLEASRSGSGTVPGGDLPDHLSDEAIEEKYDELYAESPFKAKRFLDSIEAAKVNHLEKSEKARADKAIKDFKSTFPECSEEAWDTMNDPKFWQKHDDIVALRDSGDIFTTLVTAYTRHEQSKVNGQVTKADVAPAKTKDKTERKKAGQVIRTAIKPVSKAKPKVEQTKEEINRDYIKALKKQAQDRMRIPD